MQLEEIYVKGINFYQFQIFKNLKSTQQLLCSVHFKSVSYFQSILNIYYSKDINILFVTKQEGIEIEIKKSNFKNKVLIETF